MTAKRARGGTAAIKKKRYYTPPTALDKIRHRLADGTPTPDLLHYMHGREKLPKDVRSIAEAAEKLQLVRKLMQEVSKDGGVDEVAGAVGCDLGDLKAILNGDAEVAMRNFMAEARKALVIKTMREPEVE